jgi:hypothetical protein
LGRRLVHRDHGKGGPKKAGKCTRAGRLMQSRGAKPVQPCL